MAELTTKEGLAFFFNPGALLAVADRDVDTGESNTTVYGLSNQPLRLVESVQAFLSRIAVVNSFASLTRLDNTPIWVNCPAVQVIRPALPGEYHPDASTCVSIGPLIMAVKESLAQGREPAASNFTAEDDCCSWLVPMPEYV
jgi:hypothetical protein